MGKALPGAAAPDDIALDMMAALSDAVPAFMEVYCSGSDVGRSRIGAPLMVVVFEFGRRHVSQKFHQLIVVEPDNPAGPAPVGTWSDGCHVGCIAG